MTPGTAQVAALQKNGSADARPVMIRAASNIKNDSHAYTPKIDADIITKFTVLVHTA